MEVGSKKLFCGPESFTPDNSPIVGPAPSLRNYHVAAGMNFIGILTGGGIGEVLTDWIVNEGRAPVDTGVTPMRVNRFHAYQNNPAYRSTRVAESLGNTYKVGYPNRQLDTCRGCLQSPLHSRLEQNGAHFRDVSGWESDVWYIVDASDVSNPPECTFGKPSWFPLWAAEHHVCRERVALFDITFMNKFLVHGRDAGKFLNLLSTAQVDGDVNQITYTQRLNEAGYMEADLTIIKQAEEHMDQGMKCNRFFSCVVFQHDSFVRRQDAKISRSARQVPHKIPRQVYHQAKKLIDTWIQIAGIKVIKTCMIPRNGSI